MVEDLDLDPQHHQVVEVELMQLVVIQQHFVDLLVEEVETVGLEKILLQVIQM